jgi:glutamyl-tRNA reductase
LEIERLGDYSNVATFRRLRIMRDRLSNATEGLEQVQEIEGILNLRLTYKKASTSLLNAATFKNHRRAQKSILAQCHLKECVILQTCNRVEIFGAVPPRELPKAEEMITEYWRCTAGLVSRNFCSVVEKSFGIEVLTHLFRLAAGLESMIVGEDQILGQVQDAFDEAEKLGTVGPVLKKVFDRAIKTGKEIRVKTKLNKGAVSIGSVAVNLLEQLLGSLQGRKIILIGAGEIGKLVGKALAVRKPVVIFVANRTYQTAVRLAKMLGGRAVRFNRIKDFLGSIDAVVVGTAAPHAVLTVKLVEEALENRSESTLLIIDLSQPSNVEEKVKDLPNVDLRDIDSLRGVAEENLKMRLAEVANAEAIIDSELKSLELQLRRERFEPIISALCNKAEEVRQKEFEKALGMVGKLDHDHIRILEVMTRLVVERILFHPINRLRKAAVTGNYQFASTVQELFDLRQD